MIEALLERERRGQCRATGPERRSFETAGCRKAVGALFSPLRWSCQQRSTRAAAPFLALSRGAAAPNGRER